MDNGNVFREQLHAFSEINSSFRGFFEQNIATIAEAQHLDISAIYNELGKWLMNPDYTLLVAHHFPHNLSKILKWSLDCLQMVSDVENLHVQQQICIVLSKLATYNPICKRYIEDFFSEYNFVSPFNTTDENPAPSAKKPKLDDGIYISTRTYTDYEIIDACYRLLQFKPNFFISQWNWSIFCRTFKDTEDLASRMLYHKCFLVLIKQFSSSEENTRLNNLSKEEYEDLIIRNQFALQKDYAQFVLDTFNVEKPESALIIEFSDDILPCHPVSGNMVDIDGIFLPLAKTEEDNNTSPPCSKLVLVPSTMSTLRRTALAMSCDQSQVKAICLVGPVGCGKTAIVVHLAATLRRPRPITVQMGDQTDARTLLGLYSSTDVPGEFVWRPGVLTQAVMKGHWLLLEDIDAASSDIASVLASLLENGKLNVPGYKEDVLITPGFQLFLTQRLLPSVTGLHKKHTPSMVFLEKYILQVNINPLTLSELEKIICASHKPLSSISKRMVQAFDTVLSHHSSKLTKTDRPVSIRDLFKWCDRAIVDYNVTNKECALKVLQGAIDLFCCASVDKEANVTLAKEIAKFLNITKDKAEHFCSVYKPTVTLGENAIRVGRSTFEITVESLVKRSKMTFCFTRPAVCLLERIMCCVMSSEPVLLVGETGTGKTSVVQYLAQSLGQKMVVINMNQQSDSADLLGGFKPVDLEVLIKPIYPQFDALFRKSFNNERNKRMHACLERRFAKKRWSELVELMQGICQMGIKTLEELVLTTKDEIRVQKVTESLKAWHDINIKVERLTKLLLMTNSAMAFKFIEGSLVNAVRNGDWVLLDEINLANAETLECLSSLLEGRKGSLTLIERGDRAPIVRHPSFTLFACMNPSTDIGKRDLPTGIRSRFTEFYLDELAEKTDLLLVTRNYLKSFALPRNQLEQIVDLYLQIKRQAMVKLCDGQGQKPHYSLRSLCRALRIAARNPCRASFQRNIYEACCLSFLTQLNKESYDLVHSLIVRGLFKSGEERKMVMGQALLQPLEAVSGGGEPVWYKQVEGYWVTCGNFDDVAVDESYILTDTVRRNLKDLVRVVAIGNLPVLIQGSTSIGKTSLINYLAKLTGNKCVRINNHEHTDLQEYLGTYIADETGKLVFREGLLVEAMRQGHWIILDELNLAPTDVLEALNRLLDDNRELYLTETQETVKARDAFKLFATQNPPGQYAGRKPLSRAFRNRFAELHWTDIPNDELVRILHMRCKLPESRAKSIVRAVHELQLLRRQSATFSGKEGFVTLRDLFRWGERYRLAGADRERGRVFYDWEQHIAEEGYILLAGRVRKAAEKDQIASILAKYLKRTIDPENLYTLSEKTSPVTKHILEALDREKTKHPNIVWTSNLRRLAVHTAKAMEFKEPVLLVGETGCGKTTVCQILANDRNQQLTCINCHMHTESSDFIGGLRPVREKIDPESKKLFEWADGPLIKAMNNGHIFLADEISLADDSVLERLNSLLEPERSLLLSEKGISDPLDKNNSKQLVIAHESFHFIGTMNPGGDFGKKELSPALRNRFTEIWCEPCEDRNDLIDIIENNLREGIHFGNRLDGNGQSGIGESIIGFVDWFKGTNIGKRLTITIRDILSWVRFINACKDKISCSEAYIHGALLTFLDALGTGASSSESYSTLSNFYTSCITFLSNQLLSYHLPIVSPQILTPTFVTLTPTHFGIHPFLVPLAKRNEFSSSYFNLDTPTSLYNAQRVLRALCGGEGKPILLEGSPGVGKTSLVTALARQTRNKCVRINLSDQTDISDLFGADLPVEGGLGGEFSWKDGPFLQALKSGDWILLDELNLATQSVLEGLNACFDHRGEIYIPELDKSFQVKPNTALFACQNPLHQGSGRRGLPQSFLNRFTSVHLRPLTSADFTHILRVQFRKLPPSLIEKMVEFNERLVQGLSEFKWGTRGGPWEMNLRDLVRWCEVTEKGHGMEEKEEVENDEEGKDNNFSSASRATAPIIYCDRLRTLSDRAYVKTIFREVFGCSMTGSRATFYQSADRVCFGDVTIPITTKYCLSQTDVNEDSEDESVGEFVGPKECSLVLRQQCGVLRSLVYGVRMGWMTILVGGAGCGKTSVIKTLARLTGKSLYTLPVTSSMDTTDILGGFEQTDYNRHLEKVVRRTERLLYRRMRRSFNANDVDKCTELLRIWEEFRTSLKEVSVNRTLSEETKLFLVKLSKLNNILTWLTNDHNGISSQDKDVIASIHSQVSTIERNVRRERTLNAGGKFEWVDSILIKCLQEGNWLVVDNVNLCSAAVLDRLNGLLEPNGVLTVGERGVDAATGQMVQIKPHKKFRIFLTMDPKNGEISRAMRNRGLEIYILNEKEVGWDGNPKIRLDIKSLINLRGLHGNRQINCLLAIHKFINDIILGEHLNINHVLLSSFLIHEQISRGISFPAAFSDTVIDTYCRSRSKNDFNTTNPEETIREQIKILLSDKNAETEFNSSFTLTTGNVKSSVQLEQIQCQSALFANEISRKNVDLEMAQQYLIQSVMLSSAGDFDLRVKYLLELGKQHAQSLSGIENLKGFTGNSRPFDVRFTPDLILPKSIAASCSEINKFYLKMYFATHKEMFELKSEAGVKKISRQKQFSILQYVTAVANKKITNKIDDVVIANVYQLLRSFDEFIVDNLLSEGNNYKNCTDEHVAQILSLLQYRIRLFECLKLPVSHITKSHFDILIRNVHVHYKWFIKHAIKDLVNLAESNLQISEGLTMILTKINADLPDYFSTLKKIAKRFGKIDSRSPPLTSDFQLEFYQEFWKLLNKFDVYNKVNTLESICWALVNSDLRKNALQVIRDTSFVMEEIFPSFIELKTTINQLENDTLSAREEVQVLPLTDFICLLNCYKIRNNSHASKNSLGKSITVPIKLLGLLDKSDQRYHHEVMYEFSKYFANSAAVRPNKFLEYRREECTDYGIIDTSLNAHGCVLTYLVNKITVANFASDDIFVKATMRNYGMVKEQRTKVLALLWSNYYQINSKEYDVMTNEKTYLQNSYVNFKATFAKTLEIKIQDPTIADILQKIDTFYEHCSNSQEYILIKKILTQLEIESRNLPSDVPSKEILQLNSISNTYILLNYFKFLLNTKLSIIDPLTKVGLKKKYCLMEKEKLDKIKAAYINQGDVIMSSCEYVHPYCHEIDKKIAEVDRRNKELGHYVAIRPNNISYDSIYKKINDSLKTILSSTKLLKMYEKSNAILNNSSGLEVQEFGKILVEIKSFISSLDTFLEQLKTYQYLYPDVVQPVLTNVSEILYGLKIKFDVLRRVKQEREYKDDCSEFTEQRDLVKEFLSGSAEASCCEKMARCVRKMLRNEETDLLEKREILRLSLINIRYVYNLCLIEAKYSQRINTTLFQEFSKLVEGFISEWRKQEDDRKSKEIEEESLYKTKTKAFEKSDDEQMAEEFKELFPSFHDNDFLDMQSNNFLEHDNFILEESAENQTKNFHGIITNAHVSTITSMHIDLVQKYAKTLWLNPQSVAFNTDPIGLFLQKYKLFALILERSVDSMTSEVDRNNLAEVQIFLSVACHFGDTDYLDPATSPSKVSKNVPHNFYKDPKVDDILSGIFVLEEVAKKVNLLLGEWPDHPVLSDIMKIINRVLNFDITSPVSRFLTGFEILLTKCHEWEENAHSGVTLSEHIQSVISIIIQWRKMELNMWKDCLSHTFLRLNEPIPKWWCYIYDIMLQFTQSDTISNEDLIESIQKFMFQSNLAEFANRVRLLKVFNAHVACLEKSSSNGTFMNILWNMSSYFEQFLPNVEAKVKELRAPIEKKLKDYVKIVRWKDVSYWAIKATLEKTQKTLHKFMKEFETELKLLANSCFTNNTNISIISSNTGIWDRPQRNTQAVHHYTLSSQSYLANKQLVQKISTNTERSVAYSVLSKASKYFQKSLKICRFIVEATKYPNLIKQLDGSIGIIISTSEYLQNLEVDRSLEKPKQISQSKGHLQQKQRELATLFKTLTNIGLSYRRGIIQSKLKADTPKEYLLEPLDLDAGLHHLHQHSSFNANDQKILTMWKGVETYYKNSLIRLEILNNSLNNPSKDLGLRNIERCRGFAHDLLHCTVQQKEKLTESFNYFYNLRYFNTILNDFCEGKHFLQAHKLNDTEAILKETFFAMEQLKLLLISSPDEPTNSDNLHDDLPILSDENNITFIKHKNDNTWENAHLSMTLITSSCDKILSKIQGVKNIVPSITYDRKFLLFNDFAWLVKEIENISENLSKIIDIFNNVPFGDKFKKLSAKYEEIINNYQDENVENLQQIANGFGQNVQSILERSMLIFQEIFKKYSEKVAATFKLSTVPEEAHDDDDEEFLFKLEDNHFKQELVESLFDDCAKLQMDKLNKLVSELGNKLTSINPQGASEIKDIISHILPSLEQTILLFQYFFTQQVSAYRASCKLTAILLNIFINLSTKGFCIPPDLASEMQKEIEGKQSGGMGLGEGEGEKDVSDRIESEDQLEDAIPEGQEKKKEKDDKECQEEEKGIEMSDDFDAELQDVAKKDDESDDENSSHSDAEEQMGDTQDDADQLDQEIWGSDTEELDTEETNKDDQHGNKGETLGEEKLAANEERSAEGEDKSKEDKQSKERQEKEINEMEEKELDEDQIDPYHGNQPELPEPEAFDLPDNMELDDGGKNGDDDDGQEENPFDVDVAIKEQIANEEQQEDEENVNNNQDNDLGKEDEDEENGELEKDKEKDEVEGREEEGTVEDGLKNVEDEGVEEENVKDNQQSGLDTTKTNEEAQAMDLEDVQTADNVETTASKNDQSSEPNQQTSQKNNQPDKHGVGQSQSEDASSGHKGRATKGDIPDQKKPNTEDVKRKRQKPGESNEDRTLGNSKEPVKKRVKTLKDDDIQDDGQNEKESDLEKKKMDTAEYQHIKESKISSEQVLDTATKDQAKEDQSRVHQQNDENDAKDLKESSEEVPLEEDKQENVDLFKDKPQKLMERTTKDSEISKQLPMDNEGDDEENEAAIKMNVDGEFVQTATVRRGGESMYHTHSQSEDLSLPTMTNEQLLTLKQEIEKQIAEWHQIPSDTQASETWEKMKAVTFSLAQNLSEQLRLVLEPTQASRLKGDYRTGRRINMRKVIPYIASQFRKDKIWLRRTKPSKREYQIVLAMDDSSSMHDNHAKEMAFESVAVISKALTLLESGQISVLSFGEKTQIIHKLTDTFTDHSGCRLMQQFQFKQNNTCVANLVDFATEMLKESATNINSLLAKLLVIISDGRGIFSEGEQVVHQAVRRAKLSNIFMVFVIVDSMNSSESILDIRMTKFEKSGVKLLQYMDEFPFPFYIILQDLNLLPNVLSDALRQWFEMVTNTDR